MKLLKLIVLYTSLMMITVMYSSAEDGVAVTSKVHFEYQQF